MDEALTIELPEKAKVTKVMYANAPLRLNGIPQAISIDELYKKVSHPFIYSEALFSKEAHAPYLKQGSRLNIPPTDYLFKQFEKHGFTDLSSFVICPMDSLGHGVFANKDFDPGECFILYAGTIMDTSHSEDDSTYAFSYGDEICLSVDATKAGNISRFIQHMPMNLELFVQQASNKPGFNKKLQEDLEASSDFWQWRNIVYKAGLTKKDVAWANLSIMLIPLQGVPCIVLYNTQKITKGDQLGISYGSGYWTRREIKPELFDMKGNIIPSTKYGYKEIAISLPIMEIFKQLPTFEKIGVNKSYTATMFEKDLQRKLEVMQPVWFSHLAEPVSIFKLRELLLEYHVIGKEYDQIETDFVKKLRDILPSDFTVKIYERDPHQKLARPVYDVICTTNNLSKWSLLTSLLKGPLFTSIENKCLKLTQEVIIMNIGHDVINQTFLLTMLNEVKEQGFFEKVLPEELVPVGPTRNHQTGFIKANSDEAISQILLHNPDFTKKDIQKHYQLVDTLFDSMAKLTLDTDVAKKNKKEQELHKVTSTFFKDKAPTHWKVYPSNRLTGKYIGHQVRFFTFPIAQSSQAEPFYAQLKQQGFEVELKKANDKPSLVVDLTHSKFTCN